MQITWGGSRLVIIGKTRVYKLARFRLWRLIKLLTYPVRGHAWRSRLLSRGGGRGFWHAAVDYLMPGIMANAQEYEIYQRSLDVRLCPTLENKYGNLLNVQVRGHAMRCEGVPGHILFPRASVLELSSADALRPDQFCQVSGAVVLVDYGNRNIGQLLKQ